MPTTYATANRLRVLVCSECEETFTAPRIGRPPTRCSEKCQKAAAARWQRDYRRQLVQDREALAALRETLRAVAA
jgi:uncharacterized paraquat-inducible protein A